MEKKNEKIVMNISKNIKLKDYNYYNYYKSFYILLFKHATNAMSLISEECCCVE